MHQRHQRRHDTQPLDLKRKRRAKFPGHQAYEFKKRISGGADAEVELRVLNREKLTTQEKRCHTWVDKVAVKKIDWTFNFRSVKQNMDKEMKVVDMVSGHTLFPEVYETRIDYRNKESFIYMEVAPMSLDYYISVQPLPVKLVKSYMRQLLMALEYLHNKNILHGDVKPGNILIYSDGRLQLTDFNRSHMNFQEHGSETLIESTYIYMAPEVLMQKSGYTFSTDLWSAGLVMLEMCLGYRFNSTYEFCILYNYAKILGRPPKQFLTSRILRCLFSLICKDSRHQTMEGKEWGLPKEYEHTEASSFLHALFHWDPKERPTASDLLKHPFINTKWLIAPQHHQLPKPLNF